MKRKTNIKLLSLFILLIISSLIMVACDSGPQANNIGDIENRIVVEHELGETIIDGKPEKIIVFDYGILDTLDSIGEDIIGLPQKSLPQYLDKYAGKDYTDVGSLKEPNFEKIYELNPDLIIISGRQAELYDEFQKIAPTLYVVTNQGEYINSFKSNMEMLGKVFKKEELIKEKVHEIEAAIAELREKTESMDKNALFIMANDGNLSAYGLGSRFGVLHEEFGLTPADPNIDSSTHGQKISFEYIVEKNPDYIYVMDRAAVADGNISAEQVMDNDLIKSTTAYKMDNIIYLDAHIWYVSSGGITGTLKMIEEVENSLGQ